MNVLMLGFLDGFAPSKNPEMWNDDLYNLIFRFTKPNGTFATFTAASAVRKGLESAGFNVTKRKGFGKKTRMFKWVKNTIKIYRTFNTLVSCSACENGKQDFAIIGGGIASLCAAISLVKRGAKLPFIVKMPRSHSMPQAINKVHFIRNLAMIMCSPLISTCTLSVTVANYLIGQSNKT